MRQEAREEAVEGEILKWERKQGHYWRLTLVSRLSVWTNITAITSLQQFSSLISSPLFQPSNQMPFTAAALTLMGIWLQKTWEAVTQNYSRFIFHSFFHKWDVECFHFYLALWIFKFPFLIFSMIHSSFNKVLFSLYEVVHFWRVWFCFFFLFI